MAEIKWIKIVTDIFDDEKIMMIEAMPDAYAIIVAWFKLLCLAGKQNNGGVLLLNNRIPYTDEMLATIFRMNVNTVRLALGVFERYGMIELIDGTVTIPNWEKHQNIETLDKIREQNRTRKQNERARKRLLLCDSHVTSRDSHAKEEDIEEKLEREEDVSASAEPSSEDSTLKEESASPKKKIGKKRADDPPPEPAVFQIPLIDGTMYDVTQSEIDMYASLYPAVDVPQQIRAIIGWNISNPKKRKTRGGIKRHINTWLADKQNKSRTVYNGGSQQSKYVPIPSALPTDCYDNDENPFKR